MASYFQWTIAKEISDLLNSGYQTDHLQISVEYQLFFK